MIEPTTTEHVCVWARLYREVLHREWPYAYRPRPHTHPSLNCYKNHKCRCLECCVIGTAYMREKRAERIRNEAYRTRTRKRGGTILPLGELERLRREVGLE